MFDVNFLKKGQVMRSLSMGLMVLALAGCGKDHKGKDTEKNAVSQNPDAKAEAPAPVTPVTPGTLGQEVTPTPAPKPASIIPAELLGFWTVCSESDLGLSTDEQESPIHSARDDLQFDADGNMIKTFSYYTDESCTKQVTEADIGQYITKLKTLGIEIEDSDSLMQVTQTHEFKGTYEVVSDLGQGLFQYNAVLPENTTLYSTLQLKDDRLTVAYECDQEDVDSDFCPKITGDSAQNRAVIDSRAKAYKKVQ
jgi:hypothetical protein